MKHCLVLAKLIPELLAQLVSAISGDLSAAFAVGNAAKQFRPARLCVLQAHLCRMSFLTRCHENLSTVLFLRLRRALAGFRSGVGGLVLFPAFLESLDITLQPGELHPQEAAFGLAAHAFVDFLRETLRIAMPRPRLRLQSGTVRGHRAGPGTPWTRWTRFSHNSDGYPHGEELLELDVHRVQSARSSALQQRAFQIHFAILQSGLRQRNRPLVLALAGGNS